MKYSKAIDMTNETLLALEEGNLVLPVGQWVRFGRTLSRYIGRTKSGSLWMIHSSNPYTTKFSRSKFLGLLQHYKNTQLA